MHSAVFVCPEIKCAYAIDSEGLNKVQLQVLRRTAKRCPDCGNLQRFMEQTSLPNIQTNQKSYGGTHHAKTSTPNTKSITAKRRAARDAKH